MCRCVYGVRGLRLAAVRPPMHDLAVDAGWRLQRDLWQWYAAHAACRHSSSGLRISGLWCADGALRFV